MWLLRMVSAPAAALLSLNSAWAEAQDPKQKTLDDLELVGDWIYDDLSAGFAQAAKSGKPLLVVFR